MSVVANFHAPSLTPSCLIQIGQKSGFYYLFIYYLLFECEYNASQASLGLQPRLGLAISLTSIVQNLLVPTYKMPMTRTKRLASEPLLSLSSTKQPKRRKIVKNVNSVANDDNSHEVERALHVCSPRCSA